jgi:hypothetical protein
MRDISDQVMTQSRRFISWAKPLEMMATGSASTHRPASMVSIDQNLPSGVSGVASPLANRRQRRHRPVGGLPH